MPFGKVKYDVPSTFQTFLFFFVDIVVYLLLAWYFDHVDSSNRGKSYSALFFLEKKYWVKDTVGRKRARNLSNEVYKKDIEEISKLLNEKEERLLNSPSFNNCTFIL